MGPRPHSSTPLTYRNRGMTVIGPANINININEGSFKLKIFRLFLKSKKNANKANGNMKRLSIKRPTSVSTLTFFLRRL